MSTFLGFQVRARAEIKEEQMRQEIIATTGQMHAMRDNFVTRIDDTSKEVEDRTEELTAKIAELEKLAVSFKKRFLKERSTFQEHL